MLMTVWYHRSGTTGARAHRSVVPVRAIGFAVRLYGSNQMLLVLFQGMPPLYIPPFFGTG